MNKKFPVQFHFLISCTLQNRVRLKLFICSIFKKEKKPLEQLSIIFCDDSYLLGLNRRFLQHDFYTDILSFPISNANQHLIAEIYISVDRVRENARSYGSTLKAELHRVIFHGVLHFCGYKDKSAADKKTIRTLEDKYLKSYW
jgi:probable rRNA maturation factor